MIFRPLDKSFCLGTVEYDARTRENALELKLRYACVLDEYIIHDGISLIIMRVGKIFI